jgi:hypothetical protein
MIPTSYKRVDRRFFDSLVAKPTCSARRYHEVLSKLLRYVAETFTIDQSDDPEADLSERAAREGCVIGPIRGEQGSKYRTGQR